MTTRRPHCRIHAAITDIPMIARYTRGLTRSSQSRVQGFISICDKTSAFNESPSLRAVRLNQWHGVADGYAFGRWHKWIPGYFFQCCPRQRLQYPWVNFTVRPENSILTPENSLLKFQNSIRGSQNSSGHKAMVLVFAAGVMLMFRRVGGEVKRNRMKRSRRSCDLKLS